jgi:hypothetical protein
LRGHLLDQRRSHSLNDKRRKKAMSSRLCDQRQPVRHGAAICVSEAWGNRYWMKLPAVKDLKYHSLARYVMTSR